MTRGKIVIGTKEECDSRYGYAVHKYTTNAASRNAALAADGLLFYRPP